MHPQTCCVKTAGVAAALYRPALHQITTHHLLQSSCQTCMCACGMRHKNTPNSTALLQTKQANSPKQAQQTPWLASTSTSMHQHTLSARPCRGPCCRRRHHPYPCRPCSHVRPCLGHHRHHHHRAAVPYRPGGAAGLHPGWRCQWRHLLQQLWQQLLLQQLLRRELQGSCWRPLLLVQPGPPGPPLLLLAQLGPPGLLVQHLLALSLPDQSARPV
jgi:hypothetical protein